MIVDLHCHSTASDGELAPEDLLALAHRQGVQLLALTDHDTVAGAQALQSRVDSRCRLVNGVEISATWNKRSIHIVGLDFALDAPVMVDALAGQRQRRFDRAVRIGEKLAARGIQGGYEGAQALAGDSAPCRPHFARWLVAEGHCADGKQAFSKYLGARAMAGLDHQWPDLEQAVGWILQSGGIPVLAHPEDYQLTRSKLRRLLREFCAAGGRGMELAAPGKPEHTAAMIEALCAEFGLAASVGSDYHTASQRWRQLGRTRPVPPGLAPVWDSFQ